MSVSSTSFKALVFMLLCSLCVASCDQDDGFDEGPFFSKRTEILRFSFRGLDLPVEATINRRDSSIIATVPFGTNRSNLVPTIEVSPKATVSPPSGIANNFTSPATYLVTAEDGTVQTWTVTVNEGDREALPVLVLSNPIWNLSPSGTGVPSFFTQDGERGLAYGNGKLYLTSNNDKILTFDPATGNQLGELNMTGVEGGEPKIADVAVSADGTVLACNTVEWTSSGGGPATTFKIYRWDNETSSAPSVWLSYTNTQYRMGDSFTVIGDISGEAVILTAFGRKFLPPTDRGIVFKWTVSNGVLNPEPELISIAGLPTLTRFGSRPHAAMLSTTSQEIYVNANDIEFTLNRLDGSFISRIPNDGRQLFDGFTSYFEVFQFAGKTVLATVFPRSSRESRLILLDVTFGLENVTRDDVILSQNFLTSSGEIGNVNASGAIAVNIVNNNNVEVYCLITNQALVRFNLTTEVR